jgi:hypothetical protein
LFDMFWKKKAPPITQEEYQSRLNSRSELVRGKLETIEKELFRCRQQMRTAPKGSAAYRTAEARALLCLKHRKMLENQMGVYTNQTLTMDQVQFANENLRSGLLKWNWQHARHLYHVIRYRVPQ